MKTTGAGLAADYPRTQQELEEWFSSEDACRSYLAQLRWPQGFVCPHCGQRKAWPVAQGHLFECSACHRQTSVIAGTIFEGTRKPLVLWFRTMWWVTNQKTGTSALSLQRALGFGSYQTAWAWLHKLRRAMVRPGRDRLSGRIEVDETYVGGDETAVCGRQTRTKSLVVIAAEEDGGGIGRIRMGRVTDASAASLQAFIKANIEPGSLVHTDGWRGYAGVNKLGYVAQVTTHNRSNDPAHVSMPRVHRVASLLKRWLLGTYQGAVAGAHLDYYLDEFTFRFNRRTSRSRGMLFYRLVQQAVSADPVPYKNLVGGTRNSRRQDVVPT